MSIHCSNCGYQNDDTANFCEACGHALSRYSSADNNSSSSDFEYDFGGSSYQSPQYQQDPFSYPQNAYSSSYVRTSVDAQVLNKANKRIYGWSIFLLVVAILNFIGALGIVNFFDDAAVASMKQLFGDKYSAYFAVTVAHCIFEVIFFVLAIVFAVNTMKMHKTKFPVNDSEIFKVAERVNLIAIPLLLCAVVMLCLSIASLAINVPTIIKQITDDGINVSVEFSDGGVLFNALLIAASAVCMKNSKTIVQSKEG